MLALIYSFICMLIAVAQRKLHTVWAKSSERMLHNERFLSLFNPEDEADLSTKGHVTQPLPIMLIIN